MLSKRKISVNDLHRVLNSKDLDDAIVIFHDFGCVIEIENETAFS